ncbi:MAG: DUF5343 domain-containing protein [Devosia marina]|uniref:DUF5343 domain-containing protein n=1 Tax=Devosia marina TaxID=2683198 RepID=UPI0032EE5603
MASHPYISGAGNITQMIGFLRKNFPGTVNSDTVKKYGLASKNESYVINALQFLGLIDEEGKRTDTGHEVLSTHDEEEFRPKFAELIKTAYSDLFDIFADEAWALPKTKLIGYFRQADKTSDIIGTRQAAVFQALRSIAGYEVQAEPKAQAATGTKRPKAVAAKSQKTKVEGPHTAETSPATGAGKTPTKSDMALTVRIEINLPAEGTQETYDAIFKSIKANLYP